MSNLQVTGILVDKQATQVVSDKFKKRSFALDITEEVNGNSYPNFAQLQATQNRCELLDNFNIGDVVTVSFNIRGNKNEKDGVVRYFNNLDAWKIERAYGSTEAPQQPAQPTQESLPSQNAVDQSLPF